MTDSGPGTPRRSAKRGSGSRGTLALVAIMLLAGVLVVGAIGTWYLLFRTENPVEPGRQVQVEITSGSGTDEIARLLADAGIIRNANMFMLVARKSGSDGRLKAGIYTLATGMPDELVISKLEAGPEVKYVKVTIPEGFVITQIAARLEKQAGIPADEFERIAKNGAPSFAAEHPYLKDAYRGSLEGYLFPKTYLIKEGSTASDVARMMLNQFDNEIAQVDLTQAGKRGLSLPDVVTVASMIERESKLDRERPLVSSVVYNRLKQDMRLQICSTIEYVHPVNRLRLTDADLKTDSPYNTYLHKGLPPGPISNPGLKALQAAAHPADTKYIYYVLTGKDGSHTFAATSAAFLRAKQKSKEVFGQ